MIGGERKRKKLDQHCALCYERGVSYVKAKGGFWKLCESCEKVLAAANLLEENLAVHAMEAK